MSELRASLSASLLPLVLVAARGLLCVAAEPAPAPSPTPQIAVDLPGGLDLAVMRSGVQSGAVNAFWAVDRQYRNTPTLTPRSAVTIADLKGPGVVTAFHIANIPQLHEAKLLRGVAIEIYYDGAKEPAVLCPLPDFFGDGLNGRSVEFASRFVEKAPFAYNAYFPMPFKESIKIVVRNDTDRNAVTYAFVEWQTLPRWDPAMGYFHAAWRRKGFLLTNDSREEFLRVKGRGHFVGRQFSVASDEPRFAGFSFVMEGNNEVDVDGRRRQFDYLGSEDSFTFSWGFQRVWVGPHAGMTHVSAHGPNSRLSIYRFHDHAPIRFEREFAWTIDWRNEDPGFGRQSGWVDYATVFYWYQDSPAGFQHEPLPPVDVRCLDILPCPEKAPDLRAELDKLPADPQLENKFTTAQDVERTGQ